VLDAGNFVANSGFSSHEAQYQTWKPWESALGGETGMPWEKPLPSAFQQRRGWLIVLATKLWAAASQKAQPD